MSVRHSECMVVISVRFSIAFGMAALHICGTSEWGNGIVKLNVSVPVYSGVAKGGGVVDTLKSRRHGHF